MSNDIIKCPKCGHQIPVTDVLQHRLREQVSTEVEKRLDKEKEILIENFKKDFETEKESQLKTLRNRLDIEAKKRQEAEEKELALIKQQAEFEDRMKKQELIIARKVQEEKKQIEEKIRKESQEEYQYKLLEKNKQLEDTKKALAEAQRKAQQGSMQTQGEVVELSLEELLKKHFSQDIIEPVPKGISGADIIQKVFSKTGQEVGIICWESKQTKAWTEDWVQKLKDDGHNIKADLLVLVSEAQPKNIANFGIYKGIWVTNFNSIVGLTTALRSQLVTVRGALSSQENKEEKKDILYNYLCSHAFSNKIESIVENFINMKTSLEQEKNAMMRIWAKRETQLNRLTENTAKMYGEIQGIAGNKLPEMEILSLESAAEIKEPKEKNNIKDSQDQFNLFE